uniref:Reverse transcriptase domain-containing protein n=1 Tax=Tanacetum cinerariifolium TaxID=118510 RepID=A0A6L2JZF4_TANCI|nr:reverse transcriptase domain-containing protein [Tanacetum cinerariifolium]
MDIEEINEIIEEEGEIYMAPIINCLERGVWPEDQNEARALRMKIGQYVMEEGVLFKKSYLMPMLRCVGPLLEAPGKVRFIIVAVDYFTKWIEAKTLAKTIRKEVKKFTWDNIVCRSLMKGIKTRLWRERKGWVDKLPNVLWAHQTSLKTSNVETPNSLMFGSDAVISAKIGMPTHRTMMIKEGNEEDMRFNLDLLQERKKAVAIREARYKMKMEHYYNKRVRPMSFKEGEYVYRKIKASRVENLEKIGPKWEGPYLVVEAYQNGSYKLRTMDDSEVPRVWHEINMRRCYL